MIRPDGSIDVPQHYLNSEASNCSVLFLHKGLRHWTSNTHIYQMATALQRGHHHVTFLSSDIKENTPELNFLNIYHVGLWIPNSIFGYFKNMMSCCKSLWMVFTTLTFPPNPYPDVIFSDLDEIALPILHWFTNSKTVYIKHFSCTTHNAKLILPSRLKCALFQYAHVIVVRNDCIKRIVKYIYAMKRKKVIALYPSYGSSLQIAEIINIKNLLPKIKDIYNCFIFATFADYTPMSEFKLIFDALYCLQFLENDIKTKIHIVIVFNCRKGSEQEIYYKRLRQKVNKQCYAKQVTFVSNNSIAFRKTLIEASVAVIVPWENEVNERTILETMSLKTPIIGTQSGICRDILLHNVSGLLLLPDPLEYVKQMIRLSVDVKFRNYLGSMAFAQFMGHYSYDRYIKNLEDLLWETKVLS